LRFREHANTGLTSVLRSCWETAAHSHLHWLKWIAIRIIFLGGSLGRFVREYRKDRFCAPIRPPGKESDACWQFKITNDQWSQEGSGVAAAESHRLILGDPARMRWNL
jgi:hypothetical protein